MPRRVVAETPRGDERSDATPRRGFRCGHDEVLAGLHSTQDVGSVVSYVSLSDMGRHHHPPGRGMWRIVVDGRSAAANAVASTSRGARVTLTPDMANLLVRRRRS